ncbi:MAG: hypothetical protein J6K32_02860 [Clostridia bacterium]|nr:hypothetical protein [Clostridia bacterium]
MDWMAQADAFFAGRPESWRLFEALRLRLTERRPGGGVRVMKTCIAFDDPKPYCYVSIPRRSMLQGKSPDSIQITFSRRTAQGHPRFAAVVPVSRGRYTVHLLLERKEEIDDELLGFLCGDEQR